MNNNKSPETTFNNSMPVHRYVNKDGIYSRDNTSPRYTLHSSNSSLPTFLMRNVTYDIHEVLIIGKEIMINHNYDELCLVEQETLACFYIRRSNEVFSIHAETGFDIEGPLYGLNLSCSY